MSVVKTEESSRGRKAAADGFSEYDLSETLSHMS